MEHNRVLRLEHGINFRELGGYATTGGQTIRWQKLLRCGGMSLLSAHDLAYLDDYGLRYDIDLRQASESQMSPDRYPTQTNYQNTSVYPFTDRRVDRRLKRLFKQMGTDDTFGPQTYAKMVTDAHPVKVWQNLFATLLANDQPDQSVLFHCAAGKDRTGVAGTLIMTALDVPRETIVQDYLLTNAVFMAADQVDNDTIITEANNGDLASRFNSQLNVEADNLKMIFNVFDDIYGGGIGYLREVLGLSQSDIKTLRQLYLD
ncbi:tyrosine-protein phosphatase [Lactiplantibacillus mudanjiangensis]|uniref:Protein-tyrosine-phosphatase [Lactobacillus sp.] n=1 Tax=Lactiplantibacillus mudanjiangensis TaxID=1296538 RepID=A0A660DVX0_9LACO|nr:tyrosine-protein phosphatase [Lactiplantibacillus mudanjiangensis]VDG20359.1 protein-tyrosine-phosphatase [Lactobacillus sp.] [Lactiplantibacillus mudanjiangensis]VDG23946.1 protein-tyrosine-phosphatase [Lactobacillus sp.] [Lactiplantibacillus mudanjiangensis]VDG27126.1 protein-tyrosine-phosphatase [Lactobacillus sp.] [Lactiplantibacillus mudanjiangensis]VDG33971.1 protein-tyrosine-phosphatase [Lactobacillus sp.] [Lactiplantibacillus mudanjiangensis]